MFTDLAGFTSQAQQNEAGALELLEAQEKLVRPILKAHRGRKIKSMGDGLLVEFPNALDAVECSVDLQRTVHEHNSQEGVKPLELRVGIHLGDVQERGTDIFGDAVNIASRIEPLADVGGVCLSAQVYDQVRNKVPYRLEKLGPRSLKGVQTPIDVYRVALPWKRDEPFGATSARTRIAVLPLANISRDPADEYFADGMTEELISNLSRIGGLRVISRTSAMRYKGTHKALGEIATELDVGSVLVGSVRKASDDLRISTQLIDARNDEHLWSQDYDRKLEHVFSVQTEIAEKVAAALKVRLLSSERTDIGRTATVNSEAYLLYLRGRGYWNQRTREANEQAIECLEHAVRLDPNYAPAHAGLADCYNIAADYEWMRPKEAFPRAQGYVLRALEIDPRLPEAHASLGLVFENYQGRWQEAEREFRQAIDLNPSYAIARMWYALLLLFLQRYDSAQEQLVRALRLDPLSRLIKLNLAHTLSYAGRRTEAIERLRALIRESPDSPSPHGSLAFDYYLDSKTEEAIAEVRAAFALSKGDPASKADLACLLALAGFRDEASRLLEELERTWQAGYVSALRKAQVLFALGRRDEGFGALDQALQEGSVYAGHGSLLLDLRVRPWFSDVRRDPRWSRFERRLGSVEGPGTAPVRRSHRSPTDPTV
jgi:adenylate cyclase